MECAQNISSCVETLRAQLLVASRGWTECQSDHTIFPHQVKLLRAVLDPLYDKHGFAAAHWCTFYVASSMGQLTSTAGCKGECTGGNQLCAITSRITSPMIGLQSCVCSSLTRRFGQPPIQDETGVDLHPWGIYLADRALSKARAVKRTPTWEEISDVLQLIKRHMVEPVDEEPLHGFLWRLVATDPPVSGITHPAHFAHRACLLFHHGQCDHPCRECAHGIGHGLYYRELDVHAAIHRCVTMHRVGDTSSWHILNDTQWWRGCAGGAFHSWFNSMTFSSQQQALDAPHTVMREACYSGHEVACAMGQSPEVVSMWASECFHALGLDGAQDRLDEAKHGKCGARATVANLTSAALRLIHTLPPDGRTKPVGTEWELHAYRMPIFHEKRARGVELLGTIPTAYIRSHVKTLLALVSDADNDVRGNALRVLQRVRPLLEDKEASVRDAVDRVFWMSAGRGDSAV